MSLLSRPHRVALAAGTIGLALVASACASTDAKPSAGGGSASAAPECAAFTQYGNHAGKTVSIYSPIRDAEADLFEQVLDAVRGLHRDQDRRTRASGEFEAQIQVRADGGNPPDMAFFPQPGLLAAFAKAGKLKPPAAVKPTWPTELVGGLGQVRHRRRQLLRRAAGRQREVLRLVLAEDVQGQGLTRSPRRGTS